jgi:hypothetical protein
MIGDTVCRFRLAADHHHACGVKRLPGTRRLPLGVLRLRDPAGLFAPIAEAQLSQTITAVYHRSRRTHSARRVHTSWFWSACTAAASGWPG